MGQSIESENLQGKWNKKREKVEKGSEIRNLLKEECPKNGHSKDSHNRSKTFHDHLERLDEKTREGLEFPFVGIALEKGGLEGELLNSQISQGEIRIRCGAGE